MQARRRRTGRRSRGTIVHSLRLTSNASSRTCTTPLPSPSPSVLLSFMNVLLLLPISCATRSSPWKLQKRCCAFYFFSRVMCILCKDVLVRITKKASSKPLRRTASLPPSLPPSYSSASTLPKSFSPILYQGSTVPCTCVVGTELKYCQTFYFVLFSL